MESKKWSFLKSLKILSTAGIVEVMKITKEQKNPIKITFLFSLLYYLFSVKYTILLIFYYIIRTYKIWVASLLACPLVQRKFFFWKKSCLCICSQQSVYQSLLAGAADPGLQSYFWKEELQKNKICSEANKPGNSSGFCCRILVDGGTRPLSWFVMLSSSQDAAHSVFWCRELEGSVLQLGILKPQGHLSHPNSASHTCIFLFHLFLDLAASLYWFFTKVYPVGSGQIKFFPTPLPDSSCIPGPRGAASGQGGHCIICSDGKFLSMTELQTTDSRQSGTVSHQGSSRRPPLLLAPVTPGMTSCIWTRCRKALVSVCTNLGSACQPALSRNSRHWVAFETLQRDTLTPYPSAGGSRLGDAFVSLQGSTGSCRIKSGFNQTYLVISSHLTLLIVSAHEELVNFNDKNGESPYWNLN